jgi:SAM-dependent methyltransferase
MQIDFHYDVIYVLARYAGYNREDAKIIAHSSQYVDDAENGGLVKFTNYPSYYHIRTAHKILDKDNLNEVANFHSWVPFHFLPGNLCDKDNGLGTSFVSKLVCRENSQIAKEMMEECILRKNNYNGLHRLGISLHVYADTWAHQNFVGIFDEINRTKNLHVINEKTGINEKIIMKIEAIIDGTILDEFFPIGHGTVQKAPDLPYLKWEYTNYLGNKSEIIDNSNRFIMAAKEIFKYLKRYQVGDATTITEELPLEAEEKINELFQNITQEDKQIRHEQWQMRLDEDYFGFHDEAYPYISYGPDSWKSLAMNTNVRKNDNNDKYTISEAFLSSDWKKFHDAVKEHWDFVINHLLPGHGVIM